MGHLPVALILVLICIVIGTVTTLYDDEAPFPYDLFPISLGLALLLLCHLHPEWFTTLTPIEITTNDTHGVAWAMIILPITIRVLLFLSQITRGPWDLSKKKRFLLLTVSTILLSAIALFVWEELVHFSNN